MFAVPPLVVYITYHSYEGLFMSETFRAYTGDAIEVRYDKNRCLHAAKCVKGLPEVFDVQKLPWIQPEHGTADRIAEVVERCPTDALEYTRKDGGAKEVAPSSTTIVQEENGRLYRRGNIQIMNGEEAVQATRATLCGCGYSQNKPFCDNSEECKP